MSNRGRLFQQILSSTDFFTLCLSFELSETDQLIINLLSAAKNDVPRLMKSFLEHFDMNKAGYDGKTALHVAARYSRKNELINQLISSHGNLESVDFLVRTCHVNETLRDRRGRTALECAILCEQPIVVQYLAKETRRASVTNSGSNLMANEEPRAENRSHTESFNSEDDFSDII